MNMLNFVIWGALVLVCTTGMLFLLVSNLAVRSGEMPLNPVGATEVTHSDERAIKPMALQGLAQGGATQDTLASITGDATRLRQFLEAMPIGVAVFDDQLRVLYWNRQCEIIFGWRAADVLGRTPWESYAPEIGADQAADMLKRVNEQRDNYALTRDARRRDGSLRHCTWVVSPERDEQGSLVRALALVQDITEQRRADTAQAHYAADISALARQLLDHDAQITRRLAQTLHDRLGQTLTALRLAYDVVDANSACPTAWQDSPMGPLIDQAVKEVREALTELRPPLLNEQGLHDALDNEIRSLWRNPNRVRIALTSEGEHVKDRYPSDVEYAAFMIAREAVGNALRHAKPHHVGVHMNAPGGLLTIEIKDDGLGFDGLSELPKPGHLGLVGMRERALAVGALLTVQSLPGVGSCVRFVWGDARTASPASGALGSSLDTAVGTFLDSALDSTLDTNPSHQKATT
jgi:PAS domain S-box-containing protein